jgi:glutamyl endopeptidase
MKVWPGLNGDYSDGTPNAPYGSCTVAAAHLSSTYVNTYASYPEGDVRFDYGALKLNCSVGAQTGLLNNYGVQPTPGWTTRVVGYPDDKPMDTQWYSDKTVYTYDSYQVYYANDTVTRMSGSPVMEWTNSGWNVVAIHSRGWGTDYNTGPRITSTVSNDLYNWQYQ